MEIKVAVSKRHVHLCRNDLAILFGKDYELTKRNVPNIISAIHSGVAFAVTTVSNWS